MLKEELLFEIYKGKIHLPLHKEELNEHKDVYDVGLVYGEITKVGVESLVKHLKKLNLFENINFIDLGSGNGRLVLHMGLYDEVKKSSGVELYKSKSDFGKKMINGLSGYPKEKVNLVNCDINEFNDFFEYNLIFNNMIQPLNGGGILSEVSSKIKRGTHLVSTFQFKECGKYGFELVSRPEIVYSWMVGREIKSYLYVKI